MAKIWKDNIKSESFWLRSLFMVLFLVIYRLVDVLVVLVAISQWLYMLLTGDASSSLSRFAAGLGAYIAQIISYLSYNTEEKPFPFSDWPQARIPDSSSNTETDSKS